MSNVIYIKEWINRCGGRYLNQKESDAAKSVRIAKMAMNKKGGDKYKIAVELQRAQRNMRDYRIETIKAAT